MCGDFLTVYTSIYLIHCFRKWAVLHPGDFIFPYLNVIWIYNLNNTASDCFMKMEANFFFKITKLENVMGKSVKSKFVLTEH